MQISKDQLIAGRPAPEARELIRKLHRRDWEASQLARCWEMDEAEAEALRVALVAEGYLEARNTTLRRHVFGEPDMEKWPTYIKVTWEATVAGNALAQASLAKPVTRKTAEKALADFLDRVAQVNANPDLLWWVDRVVLFGSYLDPTKDRLGDVDLCVYLTARWDKDEDREVHHRRIDERWEASGREYRSFHEWLSWPETEVWRFLQNRQRTLSLHNRHEDPSVTGLTDRYEVIYQRS